MAKRVPGDRSVVPGYVEPMLATADGGRLRDDAKYAYEFKWDGYRAIMRVAADGTTVLTSRNNNDFTGRYPELAGAMADALGGRRTVLDGEIVALDEAGRPDFGLLQNHDTSGRAVAYFVFDVLQLADDVLLDHSYDERRKILEGIEPPDKNLVAITPSYSHADLSATGMTPQDLLDVAATSGLEGLVAKARTSKYRPGRRSPEWLKHPLIQTLEVVVGGWRPGQGNRGGLVGGLLLGAHDRDTGDLLYIGDVGTGFSHQALLDAQEKLAPLERARSPFANAVPRDRARGAHWVEPTLVGEVVYRQFTPGEHRLRHTAWRGWRPDRAPSEALVPQPARSTGR
ncbi:non-homologous end-joining DNA ligase [Amycolatopsis sp. NPDC023774]|uniref:non-homologous end-joining DNA ligase n=1 Tax=Amycolatopsis sp. NPDC023774 TaxID=3155015 RepID=UPI003409B504